MVSRELLKEALGRALSTGADYAEIFAEHTRSKSINNISGKTDKIGDAVISGVGIRIFKGTRCVSGSASSLAREAVLSCASKVADALDGMPSGLDLRLRERIFGDVHPVKIVPAGVENGYKTDYLR